MVIYVFCHKGSVSPSGGIKVIYRIAEALLSAGYNAKILLPGKNLYPAENPPDYKPTWFDTELTVCDDVDIITSEDIVILHEEAVWAYDEVTKNKPRIIMLNQGLQASMVDMPNTVSWTKACQAYQNALGSLAVSNYVMHGIHRLFGADVYKTHLIHPEKLIEKEFSPGLKENNILVMLKSTARNNMATDMLIKIMRERYPEWGVEVLLGGMTTKEVAYEMARSKIFIFFCSNGGEGLGLPPIEAAMAGCKVIGYAGVGGREHWREPLMTEIEYNNIVSFVDTLDTWTELLKDKSILELNNETRKAHSYLLATRSIASFNDDVVYAIKRLIER